MLETDFAQQLGQQLREAREWLGASQDLAARAAGLSRNHLSNIETGKTTVSAYLVGRLAKVYKRPVGYFYNEPEREPIVLPKLDRLTPHDRAEVLRFAEFLREAGPAPTPKEQTHE